MKKLHDNSQKCDYVWKQQKKNESKDKSHEALSTIKAQ